MPVPSALATDLYQLTMMAGYDAAGYHARTTFELFVRELPDQRSYLVAAGLAQALDYLESLSFTADEIAWLRSLPAFRDVPPRFFLDVLPAFRFSGEVWAVDEGEVVFAGEPLLRVTAPAPRGAARRDRPARDHRLPDLRRQQGLAHRRRRARTDASWSSAAAAHTVSRPRVSRRAPPVSSGFRARRTSKPAAGSAFPSSGRWRIRGSWRSTTSSTRSGSYMAVFGTATTLLIDTYDTAGGARRIVEAGLRPAAVRLDSGDLGALARGRPGESSMRAAWRRRGFSRPAISTNIGSTSLLSRRRADRCVRRRHRDQHGSRRAGAWRRLQARGHRARRAPRRR